MKRLTINDIAEVIKTGKTPPSKNKEYYDGNINWYNPSDINNDKLLRNSKRRITDLAFHDNKAVVFSKNTLLVTCIGDIGRVGITQDTCSSNQQITGIVPNDRIDVNFLFYWFIYNKPFLELYTNKAVVQILNNASLKKIPFTYCPPLETQKKIAAILDEADKLRQLDQQLIEKYDELTQSLFLDMFGDPVTNPKGWGYEKLGLITNMKAGKFIRASEIHSDYVDGLYLCYGGNGLRGFVNSFTHEGDFVLIGRQGALCGNVKIATGKFHATEHAIVCTPKKKYNTIWLYYLLDLLNLNRFATGAAQPGLNVSTLNDLDVVFAPYELQNQFAERVEAIEAQKVLAQQSLEKSEELFNSLLQKAFKGELV
ncbi:restriction endonuclease subunit S [Weeksellaceae bacterium KMM 9713]|uniref:Restriction endonuclease subunit S n=1 Tax=Profundicola chukchiensis TaxID=2961959 RepID=A0A9X4MZ10_9FLAO|nr:restriction endonuclease subunit S [Profundicola chukchiensis]MDG4946788.1 restriction endonuclease subunit S [Profundicola chukchiensis]